MSYNAPKTAGSGVAYEQTLLGTALSFSCIPNSETGPFDFFNDPSSQAKLEHGIVESSLWVVCVKLSTSLDDCESSLSGTDVLAGDMCMDLRFYMAVCMDLMCYEVVRCVWI